MPALRVFPGQHIARDTVSYSPQNMRNEKTSLNPFPGKAEMVHEAMLKTFELFIYG
jgi:hypothetical protein